MLTSWTPRQPKEEWKALPVVGKVSPLHDYPCLNLLIPVFSRRATDTLGTMLTENGMLLALSTDVGEYFGFICMTKLNALDLQKTRLRRKNPNERSDLIEYYAFDPSVLTNATIFRIPEQPNTYFVTDVFKERVEQSKLNGFHFIPVWPLPETSNWMIEDRDRRRARGKVKIVGEAVILRFLLEANQPNEVERHRAANLEAMVRKTLVTCLEEPYLGSIESTEFDGGEFRIFCSCPSCEELEVRLRPWLIDAEWPNGILCVKRYGNLYSGRAKEASVEYRKPIRPVEQKSWSKAKVESTLQRQTKKPAKKASNHSESDLPHEMPEQIQDSARQAHSMLELAKNADPQTVVSAIDQFVYNWQRGMRPPIPCEAEDLPYTLGSLWGEQLTREFGWQWRMITFHDHGDTKAPGLVSPDRSLVIYPIHFILGCMQDSTVDATILLSFNMLSKGPSSTDTSEQKYANLMEQVFRIVPRIA